MLWRDAAGIEVYNWTKLPLRCYACGGSSFDYVDWRCPCGVPLNPPSNSMTALIWKAPAPAEGMRRPARGAMG